MPSNPAKGAAYLLQGMRMLARPGLKRFVLIPLLVNLVVFSGAIWYGMTRFEWLMTRLQSTIPVWLAWLEWLLWPIFILALLISICFCFTLVANLIASPFNALLAEKSEALLTGRSLTDTGDVTRLLLALPRTLVDELRKILYAVLWSIPFLVLSFAIPVVGAAIWFLFTAWMLAVQYSDYPMGNHGLSFHTMRLRLRKRRFLSIGFGAAVAGLAMIPVLNFIAMPAAVAGATAMWVRELASTD